MRPCKGRTDETIIMAQTLVSLLLHVIFSTKRRADLIKPEIERDMFAFMAGVLKNKESRLLAANGTANHVHLLISLSKNIALSSLIQELKKSTSVWMKTQGAGLSEFHWQDGYAAFSVSESNVDAVKQYISRQKEKHQKKSF